MARRPSTGSRRSSARKAKRSIPHGQVHIHTSFNNTIVTITDLQGNTAAWSTAGTAGFSGSRKSTPYAARLAAEQAVKAAEGMGMQEADILVRGPGPGREAAIRAILGSAVRVRSISDVTPIPHNGCRPPKRRRV